MKARVKATGEIIEVHDCSADMYVEKFGEVTGRVYHITELDFDNLESPDYWTRLEHQYAGMAMQGILANSAFDEVSVADIAITSIKVATSLIKRLKEERK